MKKLIAMLLALTMVLVLAGCAKTEAPAATEAPTEAPAVETEAATEAPTEAAATVLTHEEYMAAAIDDVVTIETYVQANQSWWDNSITLYCQSPDGAYFLYNTVCAEEDAAKLVPGTKIQVTGYKASYEGEVEIMEGSMEILDGDTYIAEATDVTALLGTDELEAHQNEFVSFKGMTVEAVEYKNGEPGDDIYVTVSLNGNSYDFCVEVYLTGTDTDVYTAVGELKAGDVVDIEGFLYWYQGPNPHITSVTVAG